ncbi:hypothetical protein GALL_232130 [mine drainage metagenome]|uniref:Uncharacterized protein n=1 Tax=mine drainage metagenome TaxID=410659 RepID=A0A1J5RHF9_9ZZZZ
MPYRKVCVFLQPFVIAALAATVTAQATPHAAFTGAGPDDVMRVLPRQRDAQALLQQTQTTTRAGLAQSWAAQLRQLARVLRAIDLQQIKHARAGTDARCSSAHWSAGPASPCAAVVAARHFLKAAYVGALDYEKLRFPGIDGAFPAATAGAVLQGGSFIGPRGSRVLLVNLGAKPIRVDLGHWASAKPTLQQAWLKRPVDAAGARLRQRVSVGAQPPFMLPPESISVIG